MLEGFERPLGEATVAVGQSAVGDAARAVVVVLASHALTDLSEVLAGPTGGGAVALLVDLGLVAFDATRDRAPDLLATPMWAANTLLVCLSKLQRSTYSSSSRPRFRVLALFSSSTIR